MTRDFSEVTDYVNDILKYFNNNSNGTINIFGFNDDRFISANTNILLLLKQILSFGIIDINVFNASAPYFNRLHHIDDFLNSNLSIGDVSSIQDEAIQTRISELFRFYPTIKKVVSNYFSEISQGNSFDSSLLLSDSIRTSYKPIVLYSSGLADIKYKLSVSSFDFKHINDNRYLYERYEYAIDVLKNGLCDKLIEKNRQNFEGLFGLNNEQYLIVLGINGVSRIHKDFESDFENFLNEYNFKLKELCNEYGSIYVEPIQFGKHIYSTFFDFLSNDYNYVMTCNILKALCENLCIEHKHVNKCFNYNGNIATIIDSYNECGKNHFDNSFNKLYYESEVEFKKFERYRTERDILQKIYTKK